MAAGNSPLGSMIIDISLDTSKLGKSTSHLSRQMKIVNSAMRANLSGLKENGTESDRLSTKIDGLNKKQKIQTAVVEEAEKKYNDLVKTKGAGAKETEIFANTLNKEQAKLRDYTSQLKEMERQQKVMNSGWTKLGNGLGSVGSQLTSIGGGIKSVGSSLTRSITAPALGAATAVGGIVTAFGWKRLVALDSAQAQLEGLGYTVEDIDRISSQVQTAIQGTTMTMSEGTSIAAGALAAGVDEGEELEHYIKMIGNAAVGANRPIGDMAMIFNRVQGSGKLMTEELNMIEDGMPGFSSKMAEHFGVTQEEFRKMVTDGQVTSEDFLTVMEDHAGGMAEAYSNSWAGMVENTKAYIGIIGENLLSGVFEKSKESISQFIELLKSDAVVSWASSAGEILGQVFTNIVDKIRTGVAWFINLSTEGKKMIGIIAGVAVAAGPLLTALGGMTIFAGKVFTALSPLALKIGEAGGLFKFLGGAIAGLATPVGITIGIITALGAGFVIAYNKSETFRNFIGQLKDRFVEAWQGAMEFKDKLTTVFDAVFAMFKGDFLGGVTILHKMGMSPENIVKIQDAVRNIQNFFNDLKEGLSTAFKSISGFASEMFGKIKTFWQTDGEQTMTAFHNAIEVIKTVVSVAMPIIQNIITVAFKIVLAVIKMVWTNIKGVIEGGLNVIMGLVKIFTGIFTGDFSKMWEGVKQLFTGAIQFVWNFFQLMFYGRLIKGVGSLVKLFTGSIQSLWTRVVDIFTRLFQSSTQIISNMNKAINTTISNLVKAVFNFFRNMLTNTTGTVNNLGRNVWNLFSTMRIKVVETVKMLFNTIRTIFTSIFNTVRSIVTKLKDTAIRLFRLVLTTVSSVVRTLFNTIRSIFTNIFNTVRNIVTKLKNTTVNLFNTLRNSVTGTIRNLYNSVRNFFSNMFSSVRNIVGNMRNNVVNLIGRMRDGVVNGVSRMRDRVGQLFERVKDTARKAFDNMVKGAKELPGKLGRAISNGKQKAVDGIKSMGNGMINQLEKVVNGLIRGLNSVTNKIGITATIKEWNAPKFSRGTSGGSMTRNGAIAQDTLATVGDRGVGNGRGTRELVQYPNGTTGLYDNDATIFAPKGTIIWNNKQTEDIITQASMPKFSTGSGAKNQNTKKKKGLFGTMKDVLANTWDYIKNPKKAFDAIVSSVGAKFDGLKGFAATAAKGGFNFIKDKAFEWIKGIFKDNEGGLGNGKAASFMKYVMTTPYSPNKAVPGYPTSFNGGRHYGIDYGTPVGTPVHATLGGKVSKLYNNGGGLVAKLQSGDITQFFMHLSDIIKTGSVKAGDLIAKTGNSGAWTTGAHIHWQAQKGSQVMNSNTIDPRKVLKSGFATGGLVNNGLYTLGEEGYPEWVIPTDPSRRTDAMKLLAYAGKSLQKNNGNLRPNNLPNISSNNNDINELKKMVAHQQQQLIQNNEMIGLLAKIADKEYAALYNERQLARELEPEITKRQGYKSDRDARFS